MLFSSWHLSCYSIFYLPTNCWVVSAVLSTFVSFVWQTSIPGSPIEMHYNTTKICFCYNKDINTVVDWTKSLPWNRNDLSHHALNQGSALLAWLVVSWIIDVLLLTKTKLCTVECSKCSDWVIVMASPPPPPTIQDWLLSSCNTLYESSHLMASQHWCYSIRMHC